MHAPLALHKNKKRWRSDNGLFKVPSRDNILYVTRIVTLGGKKMIGDKIPFIGNFNSYSMFYILQ